MNTGLILRDDLELREEATVYTDPALRRYDVLLDLALSLHKRGLLVFRLRRTGQVGVFTVAKKENKLRLIFRLSPGQRVVSEPT